MKKWKKFLNFKRIYWFLATLVYIADLYSITFDQPDKKIEIYPVSIYQLKLAKWWNSYIFPKKKHSLHVLITTALSFPVKFALISGIYNFVRTWSLIRSVYFHILEHKQKVSLQNQLEGVLTSKNGEGRWEGAQLQKIYVKFKKQLEKMPDLTDIEKVLFL